MTCLEELDLSGNTIESMQLGCFNGLKNLKRLILIDVQAKICKDIFIELENLETLTMSGNRTFYEMGCLNGLYNLKELKIVFRYEYKYLKENILSDLKNFKKLEIIDLI